MLPGYMMPERQLAYTAQTVNPKFHETLSPFLLPGFYL
jgi:hypothetical protein